MSTGWPSAAFSGSADILAFLSRKRGAYVSLVNVNPEFLQDLWFLPDQGEAKSTREASQA
jgi:hypothetical protein